MKVIEEDVYYAWNWFDEKKNCWCMHGSTLRKTRQTAQSASKEFAKMHKVKTRVIEINLGSKKIKIVSLTV